MWLTLKSSQKGVVWQGQMDIVIPCPSCVRHLRPLKVSPAIAHERHSYLGPLVILSVFDPREHHTLPTSSTSRRSSSHVKTAQRSVPPSITIAATFHLSLIQPAPLLPCGLRHCSNCLALTPVLEFSQSAASPSPRPSLPCGFHYCPHPHAPIPVPAPVTLPRRHAVLPRLVISCTEPQYYILSSFSLRYAPRVSFPSIVFVFPSSRSPFPQSRPPPLDSLLPPFVL